MGRKIVIDLADLRRRLKELRGSGRPADFLDRAYRRGLEAAEQAVLESIVANEDDDNALR